MPGTEGIGSKIGSASSSGETNLNSISSINSVSQQDLDWLKFCEDNGVEGYDAMSEDEQNQIYSAFLHSQNGDQERQDLQQEGIPGPASERLIQKYLNGDNTTDSLLV